jgi:hypothetical protein
MLEFMGCDDDAASHDRLRMRISNMSEHNLRRIK